MRVFYVFNRKTVNFLSKIGAYVKTRWTDKRIIRADYLVITILYQTDRYRAFGLSRGGFKVDGYKIIHNKKLTGWSITGC